MSLRFGDRLKVLRDEKNLTQEELGKILNVTKANISKYERGKLQPNLETLKLISNYFDVSMDYLLGNTDVRKYDYSNAKNLFAGPGLPGKSSEINTNELTKRDLNDIEKDLEKMIDELHTDPNSGFAAYNGEAISEDDMELLKNAFKTALMTVKKINKEKYTPKKFKK